MSGPQRRVRRVAEDRAARRRFPPAATGRLGSTRPLHSGRGGAWCLLVDLIAAGAFLYQCVITLIRCTTFCWRMIGAEAFDSRSSLVGQNDDGLECAGRAMSYWRAIKRSPGYSSACRAELTLHPPQTHYHSTGRRPCTSTKGRSIPCSRR